MACVTTHTFVHGEKQVTLHPMKPFSSHQGSASCAHYLQKQHQEEEYSSRSNSFPTWGE